MALLALKEQLNVLLNSMFLEGLLDQQFQQLQMLQDGSSPGFVAEVITLFCEDSERILTELSKLLVGAQNVKLACAQFRQFYEENNKEGCIRALNVVKHEFYRVRNKFDNMFQLEQRIQAYDAKQQN
ncbi:histidine-containing phosphotransfer protein 2-like isoform X3 [Typha latifolia]|uniref:histidine-containing phosphotransfer protein 2-like isoform X3 n=1 Tax=Typha latifolia TaxID=4733 RepID=UPI003C2EC1FF